MLHPRVLVSFLAFRSTHGSSLLTNERRQARAREGECDTAGGEKANLMGRLAGINIGSGGSTASQPQDISQLLGLEVLGRRQNIPDRSRHQRYVWI